MLSTSPTSRSATPRRRATLRGTSGHGSSTEAGYGRRGANIGNGGFPVKSAKTMSRPIPVMVPLANAPRGHVWRWNTPRIAHLVSNKPGQRAVCGKRARGDWLAFQVGGVTARPCPECLEDQR